MFNTFLISLLSIHFSIANDPILIASPYPFNTSETSHIECFSNDQGIILSLTIIAAMIDIDRNASPLQYSKDNIENNGSIILTIPAPFNYSKLHSKIECRSKYHHGTQKISQLEVLSVAEITQKEFLTINTYTKQMVTINCLTYGTNVIIYWDFTKDISKNIFNSLPIGIRLHHKFIFNDTLIIDHVSYSNHYGYYRCYATNKLLDIIYEDKSIIYLNVRKKTIWIPIVIVCVVIGIFILTIILCTKCIQKKRKNQQLEKKEIIDQIKQIVSDPESIEISSYYNRQRSSKQIVKNVEKLKLQQENLYTFSHSENSFKSPISLLSTKKELEQIAFLNSLSISTNSSPQFILGNPFLDSNAQPLNLVKSYIDKFE
ncbi:unnamed protein product [Rotaria sp. Silwood1]|nr:unnamed protein product [Rotaria sp. Silwood1]CAF3642699.1 unnamed protein product [Rotaria sp. Silwood1]CAF4762432.1 unnamed protein product [Rotaria sp. Silwood1]